jgi:hypothetical protein
VLELLGAPVDGDYLGGAGEMGGGDHLKADPAAADDAHALADPDPGGVGDGAETGDDAAAEQRGLPQRHTSAAIGIAAAAATTAYWAKQATVRPC